MSINIVVRYIGILLGIKANEAPLVQKFFAGDGPLIVLLNMLAEISKLTPESAEVIGIESMLRPEYDRIEKSHFWSQ